MAGRPELIQTGSLIDTVPSAGIVDFGVGDPRFEPMPYNTPIPSTMSPQMTITPGAMLERKILEAKFKKEDERVKSESARLSMFAQQQQRLQAQMDETDAYIGGLYAQMGNGAMPDAPQYNPRPELTTGESATLALSTLFGKGNAGNQAVQGLRSERAQNDYRNQTAQYQADAGREQARQKQLEFAIEQAYKRRGITETAYNQSVNTEAVQDGLNYRAEANIDSRETIAGENNRTKNRQITSKERIEYNKTPQGRLEMELAAAGGDPELEKAAYDNYHANTGKERIKQATDRHKAESARERVKLYGQSIRDTKAYRDAVINLGYERVEASIRNAQTMAAASIQNNQNTVGGSILRQQMQEAFEKGLYDQGYKIPQSQWRMSVEEKVAYDQIQTLDDLIADKLGVIDEETDDNRIKELRTEVDSMKRLQERLRKELVENRPKAQPPKK